jgi:hypothetical protein
MFSLHWRKGASPFPERALRRAAATIALATIGAAAIPCAARCADDIRNGFGSSVDTEHLFGFTEGTDIGAAGDRDVELDSTSRFGRQGGSYAVAAPELEIKYTALQNFRITAGATFAYYDVAGVAGLGDRRQTSAQSVSFDARFLLLDRNRSPFGMMLSISPHWGFFDETSGVRINHVGVETLLSADREIVVDRLLAGLNVLFDTDRTRLVAGGQVAQEPVLGAGAAVASQVMPGVWLGGEARYLRSYDGTGLNIFSGQAVYLGPTLYARLGEKSWISAAWNFQAWGAATGVPGALDLANFERHQIKLRVGYEF